ncbi:hypothetical protein ACRQ5Q_16960 [Bradyrhizobium sp. PMVTL-01]|uniref:hypothetical protein n=1 Tax=Bradyrhizobium sp. PMVTL-01 TaxID=3434999 RepID=UPI003F714967
MTPAAVRQSYRRALSAAGGTVTVRRYYGSGSPRPRHEKDCLGKEEFYQPSEIAGPILQGDWKIILLAEDLETGPVALPLLPTDKVVVLGKELTIAGIDDKKRRIAGVLGAYELQVRG